MQKLFRKTALLFVSALLTIMTILPLHEVNAQEAAAHWDFTVTTYGTYDSSTGSYVDQTTTEKGGVTHYHRSKLYSIGSGVNVNDVLHSAYCTQPGIQIEKKTQEGYTSKTISNMKTDDGKKDSKPTGVSEEQIRMCEMYSYFGYGFNAARTNELYRVATQHLIWRSLGFTLGSLNADLKKAIAVIEEDYRKWDIYRTKNISFNGSTQTLKGVGKENKITFTDKNGSGYLSLMYKDTLPKGIYTSVSEDGKSIDVWADASFTGGTAKITMQSINPNAANQQGSSVFWYHTDAQNLAHFADAPVYTLTFNVTLERTVEFILDKKSADENITSGNSSYSLEGAVYGIYSDKECRNEIARITTDSSGKGSVTKPCAVSLEKVYYRELIAPLGYCPDPEVYEVSITSDDKASLSVSEKPGNDPLVIEIRKVAKDISGDIPSLEGAVFEVRYFDSKDKEHACWYITTIKDQSGRSAAVLDQEHLAQGYTSDPFFRTSNGTIVIPVGYLLIKEVKAPQGYTLKGATYTAEKNGKEVAVNNGVARFDVAQDDEGGFRMVTGNVYTLSEGSLAGGIRFRKNTAEDAADDEDLTTKISIINRNAYTTSILSEDGKRVIATAEPKKKFLNEDGTVYTFVTDRKGEWESWKNYLPFGTYEFYEEEAPHDYTCAKKSFADVTIDEEEKIYDLTQDLVDKKILVSKTDVGGQEVEGASLTVTDKDGNIVDRWTSSKEEHPITGLVVNETYTLHEVAAPNGYTVATDIVFTVSEDMSANEHIRVSDKRVEVKKSDGLGNEVEGAHIEVIDKNGKVVDEWISTKEAHAILGIAVKETYTLKETQAPDGYYFEAESTFTVTDDGMDQVIEMVDEPIRYTIVKKDDLYGTYVRGAKLKLSDVTDPDAVREVILHNDGITEGKEDTYEKVLLAGHTYLLEEISTPWGFISADPIRFTVDRECPSDEPIVIEMIDQRQSYFVSVVKSDAQDHTNRLKNAEFTLYTEDGRIARDIYGNECIGITDNQGGVTFNVPFNEDVSGYYLKETGAPKGYRLNRETFEVELYEDFDFANDNVVEILVNDEALPVTGVASSSLVVILFVISAGFLLFAGMKRAVAKK